LAYFAVVSATYPVVLIQSEEGYAVGCRALPGCWSQGKTEDEALKNIRDAIQKSRSKNVMESQIQ
jgi:predicted RNase H-like HicB family nuclease